MGSFDSKHNAVLTVKSARKSYIFLLFTQMWHSCVCVSEKERKNKWERGREKADTKGEHAKPSSCVAQRWFAQPYLAWAVCYLKSKALNYVVLQESCKHLVNILSLTIYERLYSFCGAFVKATIKQKN